MRQKLLDIVFGKLLCHFWLGKKQEVMGECVWMSHCVAHRYYIAITLGIVET